MQKTQYGFINTIHDTPAFILAGGLGERLSPLTENLPKPLVSFGGTHRIIDFTVSNCLNSGHESIAVLTQHKREPLHDYIRQLATKLIPENGRTLVCLPPASGKRYRGTADAVLQNLHIVHASNSSHVLIASGDHVYTMDYRRLLMHHIATGADMTMTAKLVCSSEASAFGIVEIGPQGSVTGFREKPRDLAFGPEPQQVAANMGVYVIRRDVLLDLAERMNITDTDFGHHVIPMMVHSQRVMAYAFETGIHTYWKDVGTLDNYYTASMDTVGPDPPFDPGLDPLWPIHSLSTGVTRAAVDSHSRISSRAVIVDATIRRSVISDDVRIDPGAIVEDSIILPGAHVGRNTRLRKAIVAEHASVAENAQIGYSPAMDRNRFLITAGGVVVVDGAEERVTPDNLTQAPARAIAA